MSGKALRVLAEEGVAKSSSLSHLEFGGKTGVRACEGGGYRGIVRGGVMGPCGCECVGGGGPGAGRCSTRAGELSVYRIALALLLSVSLSLSGG